MNTLGGMWSRPVWLTLSPLPRSGYFRTIVLPKLVLPLSQLFLVFHDFLGAEPAIHSQCDKRKVHKPALHYIIYHDLQKKKRRSLQPRQQLYLPVVENEKLEQVLQQLRPLGMGTFSPPGPTRPYGKSDRQQPLHGDWPKYSGGLYHTSCAAPSILDICLVGSTKKACVFLVKLPIFPLCLSFPLVPIDFMFFSWYSIAVDTLRVVISEGD